MIKLPKDFFYNLTPKQYREYLKLLPSLKDEKSQMYVMLAFTFIAMSFFGIFAINPTLSTIVELKRQYADLQFVYEKLVTKTQSLSVLLQKYQSMSVDLPVIFESMPKSPEAARLVGQVNSLLRTSNLKIRSFRTFGFEISPEKKNIANSASSFMFSLEATGEYGDMIDFVSHMTKLSRLITVESVSVLKDEKRREIILNLRGRGYYLP